MTKIKELWSKRWFKIVSITVAALLVIIAVFGIVVGCLFGNVISSVSSLKHLRTRNDGNEEGSVYSMHIKGDFFLDKFVEQGGVSNDTDLINFITSNITRGLMKVDIGESDVNCAAFTAKTPSNDVLFGRNYDFAKTNACITITDNPGKGRYKSFSTVDLNYIGIDPDKDVNGLMDKIKCFASAYTPLDGMNEKGLSCSIFMSYQGDDRIANEKSGTVATDQNDPTKDNFTSTTMQRLILDYCATVDEAVELIGKYNLHDSAKSSFHYMIADATGKSAILEWLPENGTDKTDNDGAARKLNVIYNTDAMYDELRDENDFEYQWVTNFIVKDADAYYENDDDEKGGLDRYEYIYGKLNETNGVLEDENAAMQILADVGRRTWDGGGGVTVHSVVYNLTDKTVLWVANENFGDKTATYEYSFKTGKLKSVAK